MTNRLLFFLVFFIFVFFPLQAQKESPKKEPTTNLVVLKITGDVSEYVNIEGLDDQQLSLHKLIETIYKAKNDPEVHGLILQVGEVGMGRAKLTAVTQALAKFRTSGKPIYSYFESISTGQYLIACQSSRLSMYPTGELFIPGVAMQMMFIKGLLGKIGVEADFITQGKYKSAAEMMTRESSSTPAKEANMAIIDDLYDGLISTIAQARNLDAKKVKHLLDQGMIASKEAAECKLIDFSEYQDEFEAAITAAHKDPIKKITNYNQKQSPQLDPSSIFSMFSFFSQVFNPTKQAESKNSKIAILYASGGISSGKAPPPSIFGGSTDGIYSDDMTQVIRKLRDDDTVKVVVLRIDSPGGSALASDVIYREIELLKAKKPVIASMSDVAASGGYYIAAPCDLILAERLTITGSIGVLGGKMVLGKTFEKLGIRTETLGRGKYIELFSSMRKWNEDERELIDNYMARTYDQFIAVVARGRKMSEYDVHKVAQGRVWSGEDAKEVGLVDQLGGLVDAIEEARKVAKLEGQKDVDVVPYPKPRSIFDLFREGFGLAQVSQQIVWETIPQELHPVLKRLTFLRNLTNEHVFLMLPYTFEIK